MKNYSAAKLFVLGLSLVMPFSALQASWYDSIFTTIRDNRSSIGTHIVAVLCGALATYGFQRYFTKLENKFMQEKDLAHIELMQNKLKEYVKEVVTISTSEKEDSKDEKPENGDDVENSIITILKTINNKTDQLLKKNINVSHNVDTKNLKLQYQECCRDLLGISIITTNTTKQLTDYFAKTDKPFARGQEIFHKQCQALAKKEINDKTNKAKQDIDANLQLNQVEKFIAKGTVTVAALAAKFLAKQAIKSKK